MDKRSSGFGYDTSVRRDSCSSKVAKHFGIGLFGTIMISEYKVLKPCPAIHAMQPNATRLAHHPPLNPLSDAQNKRSNHPIIITLVNHLPHLPTPLHYPRQVKRLTCIFPTAAHASIMRWGWNAMAAMGVERLLCRKLE